MKQLYSFVFLSIISLSLQAQQTPAVDFTHLGAQLKVVPSEKKVSGKVAFKFNVLASTDSIFIDAQDMQIQDLTLNNKEIKFLNDGRRLWLISDFKKSEDNLLEFSYYSNPSQTMYFFGLDAPVGSEYSPQVWTQGQGKNTSHWLPSFDDATEKLEFDLSFSFPDAMEVISNGKLVERTDTGDGYARWQYDMEHPMSSYLVAVAAGEYYQKEISSSSGIPISLYFYPGDEEKVEPTYRYTKKIFDYLEKEIGFSYPWQNYKQIPVRDFLYSGMENTTATIFSDIYVVDSIGFHDRNYVMVNAHELAHQWFGNTVTASSGEHHWLQEGFATYYALLAEREVFGEEYYYWRLYSIAEQLKARSDKGKGESIMNPKAGSVTFYQKGAWALHILREQVGEEAFRKGIVNYLEKYQFSDAAIPQFIEEMEAVSGKELSGFVENWLQQSAFQAAEALESLQKSEFINSYLSIAALKSMPLEEKKELLNMALDFPVNDYIGQEVVHQLALEESQKVIGLYRKAFETNNLLVRQAIALSVDKILQELKSRYESLLKDESYVTREAAFYNLWTNFPQDRSKYLEQLKGQEGLSDKNLRTLWLALNLATPNYQKDNKAAVYQELSGYTASQFPYLTRQNAFNYLFQLNSFSDQNLKDLLQGSQHPVSSFRSFSREMIGQLLKDPSYAGKFQSLLEELPERQKQYLENRLSDSKE